MKNPLFKARKDAGLSRKALAKLVNAHYQTVAYHERPEHELSADWRRRYAEALGVPDWQLLPIEFDENFPIVLTKVPIIGWADAGKPMSAEQYHPDDIEYVDHPDATPGDFGLRVTGKSMELVAPDGSIIVCRPTETDLTDGKYYVVEIDGQTTFKQYRSSGGPMRFEPASPDRSSYQTIYPHGDTRVIARVIRVILDL